MYGGMPGYPPMPPAGYGYPVYPNSAQSNNAQPPPPPMSGKFFMDVFTSVFPIVFFFLLFFYLFAFMFFSLFPNVYALRNTRK